MEALLKKTLSDLNDIFQEKSVLLCYSGGLDSSVLAALLKKAGIKTALLFAKSPIRKPQIEYNVKKLASFLSLKLIVVETQELKNERFLKEPENRCYYCKLEIFRKAKEIAEKELFDFIADGTNTHDISDHRPGMLAAKEYDVVSPYLKLGLGKKEISELRKILKLPVDERATTCFATRFIDRKMPVSKELFSFIDEMENQLKSFGFFDVRVRVLSNNKLLLQVSENQVPELEKIHLLLRYPMGYNIIIDTAGYRPAGKLI